MHHNVAHPQAIATSRRRGRLAASLLALAIALPGGVVLAQDKPGAEASFQLADNDRDRKYDRNDHGRDRDRGRRDGRRDDRDRGRDHRGSYDRDHRDHRDHRDGRRYDRDYRHDRDHRRYDRDYYRHERYHHYRHHAPSHVRRFTIPRRIAAELVYEFKPYYYGRVYYEEHHHYHPVYSFPVYIDDYVTYRPHAYCEGNYFAPGYFENDGPHFSLNLRF